MQSHTVAKTKQNQRADRDGESFHGVVKNSFQSCILHNRLMQSGGIHRHAEKHRQDK